jgi:hypothetical protein
METSLHLVIHAEPSQVTFCDTKLLPSIERDTHEKITFSYA